MSSLPSRPMGSGLPSRPSAHDDGDRSPPRRGGGEPRRRGGGPSGPPGGSRPPPEDDYSDWRGPPGSRPPPRRPVGGTDRDMDRRRGSGGLPMRDRSPDRFDPRFERPFDPFAGRGGPGRDRPQFRGGRSRSRSWSPPPGGARDRSRSPSRSPVMRRGGPGGLPRAGGFDGPRYSGPPGGFRDRSPPPTRRRSPGPAYRKRSPSRSPPPSHRQFGGSRGAPAPVSPELERRRTSGGRFPPPPVVRGRSPSRSPPPHIASTRDFPPQHARRGSREISSRPKSRSRSPPPPPKRYRQGSTPPHLPHSARPPPPADFPPAAPAPARSGGGPPIHPSRMAHVQQVSAPPSRSSTAPDAEREEGEVDIESEEQQPQSSVPKWGKGSVAQPPLPEIPTGPRQRFGVPTVPGPRGGGRGGARGGMGGRGGYGAGAAYDTAPAFDPSPSPVSAPLPLPPPPSNGSAPVPTGPKQRWNTQPTPTSSTLPLPPTSSSGVSPRPPVGALPLSNEEIAAQQARAEREAKEERERLEKMAKERELSMLKIQVMRWLPKVVVKVPTGPIADSEAEILRIRQNRLTVILPSQLARTLSSRKLYNELGLVMSEREVARDRSRCAESGSGAAMSRSSSGGM